MANDYIDYIVKERTYMIGGYSVEHGFHACLNYLEAPLSELSLFMLKQTIFFNEKAK